MVQSEVPNLEETIEDSEILNLEKRTIEDSEIRNLEKRTIEDSEILNLKKINEVEEIPNLEKIVENA